MRFVYRNDGPAIALIPKCGSRSIRYMLPNVAALTCDEAMSREIRVAALRDPFERLGSTHGFFMGIQDRGEEIIPDQPPKFLSYRHFIDWSFTSDDVHVRPQSSFLKNSAGDIVVTNFHLLSDLPRWWGNYYPDQEKILHINKSDLRSDFDPTYRADEIHERYAEDFGLCRLV